MNLPEKYHTRYALLGALFGLCFPIVAVGLRVLEIGWSATNGSFIADPVMWIIATAPLILGIGGWYTGLQHDLLLAQMAEAEEARRAAKDAQAQSIAAYNQLQTSRARLAHVTATEEALRQIEAAVHDFRRIIEKIGRFDLTVSLTHSQGIYGEQGEALGRTLEDAVNNLRSILSEVVNAVAATHSASEQIERTTQAITLGMAEQGRQVAAVIDDTAHMTETLAQNGNQAEQVAALADEMSQKVDNGGQLIGTTIEEILRITQGIVASVNRVDAVGQRSREIEEVIHIVEDVAEKTNLLALNAAIEAARAGVHGRGFAVVAEEVRKLAGQTQKATNQIADSIELIQREIRESIGGLKVGVTEMQGTSRKAGEAVLMLEEVVDETQQLAMIVADLARANRDHLEMSDKIQRVTREIGVVTGTTTSAAEEIAEVAEELSSQMAALDRLVNTFTLEAYPVLKRKQIAQLPLRR